MRERTTWDRAEIAERIAAAAAAESGPTKKAKLALEVAELMLLNGTSEAIEDQAVAMMYLPDDELLDTLVRLKRDAETTDSDEAALAEIFGVADTSNDWTIARLARNVEDLWRVYNAMLDRVYALEAAKAAASKRSKRGL